MLLMLTFIGAASCFSEPTNSGASQTDGQTCDPGEQRTCDCPGDPDGGVQVCREDGSGLEACSCAEDSTTSGTAGTAATAESMSTVGTSLTEGGTTSTAGETTADVTQGEEESTTGPLCDAKQGIDATEVRLFSTIGTYYGDVGTFATKAKTPREALDTLCRDDSVPLSGCVDKRAVISLDVDSIADFQCRYLAGTDPEVTGSGGAVAPSWSAFMAGDLTTSLQGANVTGLNQRFWTGAGQAGGSAENCDNWASRDAEALGAEGLAASMSAAWLRSPESPVSCDSERRLLCACIFD